MRIIASILALLIFSVQLEAQTVEQRLAREIAEQKLAIAELELQLQKEKAAKGPSKLSKVLKIALPVAAGIGVGYVASRPSNSTAAAPCQPTMVMTLFGPRPWGQNCIKVPLFKHKKH